MHGRIVINTPSSPNRTSSSVVVGAAPSSLIVIGSCLPSSSSCCLHEGQVVSVWWREGRVGMNPMSCRWLVAYLVYPRKPVITISGGVQFVLVLLTTSPFGSELSTRLAMSLGCSVSCSAAVGIDSLACSRPHPCFCSKFPTLLWSLDCSVLLHYKETDEN